MLCLNKYSIYNILIWKNRENSFLVKFRKNKKAEEPDIVISGFFVSLIRFLSSPVLL